MLRTCKRGGRREVMNIQEKEMLLTLQKRKKVINITKRKFFIFINTFNINIFFLLLLNK